MTNDATANKASMRWALVLLPFVVVLVAKTLAAFATILQRYLAITYDLWFELGMVLGQVAFQWIVMWRRTWAERLDYALALFGVSGIGAVLLWPLLFLNHFAPVTVPVAVGWFFAVVAVMFAVHWSIVVRAKLPTRLCATWVLYRLLILAVIVKRS